MRCQVTQRHLRNKLLIDYTTVVFTSSSGLFLIKAKHFRSEPGVMLFIRKFISFNLIPFPCLVITFLYLFIDFFKRNCNLIEFNHQGHFRFLIHDIVYAQNRVFFQRHIKWIFHVLRLFCKDFICSFTILIPL